jgi:tRNA G18 (ribose-2'-O)-methylase SpoU
VPSSGWDMRRALTTPELRRTKHTRDEFLLRPRRPITVVLDGVTQNYNIGAIFRLCDAFLVQQLMICGTKVELHKRRLAQAARGTQHWVPWNECQRASQAITDASPRRLDHRCRTDQRQRSPRAARAGISSDFGPRLCGRF